MKKDITAEKAIKEAARKLFRQKSYGLTRTRDIEKESGCNLALINYYYGSKEELFRLIVTEEIEKLFGHTARILNDPGISMEEIVEKVTTRTLTLLTREPGLPVFVLSEIKNNPTWFREILKQMENRLLESRFMQEIARKHPDTEPIQFLLTFMGMLLFPFLLQPAFSTLENYGSGKFKKIIKERVPLVKTWMLKLLE